MAGFDINDTYTVSAGVLITDYWNPFVIKHDNQSFYNWEQDNLPLHDLEERTNYLWEKLGWPTSSLPGMVLAVSSSIPSHLDVSCNFFLDVSSALKALPEVIRMSVCIEVCTSGNLGDLDLDNVRFEGNGALEIVNRVGIRFIGAEPNSSDFSSVWFTNDGNIPQAGVLVSSVDAEAYYNDASCLLGSSTDLPFGDATNVDNVTRGFLQVREQMATNSNRPALMTDALCSRMIQSTAPNFTWQALPLGYGRFSASQADPTGSLDLSVLGKNLGLNDDIQYQAAVGVARGGEPNFIKTQIDDTDKDTPAHGILTNNYLRRIRVSNCGGPIYIRGFVVDPSEQNLATGAYAYSHNYEEGILIDNSNGTTLENCGVMRARGCGLRVNNSHIDLRRGFASSRNYEVLGATSRSEGSIGIQANNSTLVIKTDSYVSGGEYFFHVQHNDVGLELNNSVLTGGDSYKDMFLATRMDPTILNFSHNKVGVKGNTATISVDGLISVYTNFVGMDLHDSTFHIDGFNADGNQDVGLQLYNSNVVYGKNEWRFPQGTELPLYGNDGDGDKDHFIPKPYQIAFAVNGQHLKSYGSTFKPKRLSSRDINYVDTLPLILFKDHFGHDGYVDNFDGGQQYCTLRPSVFLDRSDFELCHTKMFAPDSTAATDSINTNGYIVYPVFNKPSYGHLLKAVNGSNVVFKGSSSGPNYIVGNSGATNTKRLSNIYVGGNSTCKMLGKTFMAQGGNSIVAEDYSRVYFGPLENEDGSLAVSSWDLSNTNNHANIELHSSEETLVVNNNSTLTMRDIGDYSLIWSGSDVNPSAYDYYTTSSHSRHIAGGGAALNYSKITDLSSFISHGSLVFLPNTMNSRNNDLSPAAGGVNVLKGNSTGSLFRDHLHARADETSEHVFNPTAVIGNGHHASVLFASYDGMGEDTFVSGAGGALAEGVSHGGVCVKAMNGSHVNCTNVHFVPGPTLTDKPYMDAPNSPANIAGCHNLRIWNFGKNSSFNSSFLSVSGNYPSVAPYWGPQSYHIKPGTVWNYGEGNHNTSAVAYTAFSSFEWQYDDAGTVYMESANLGNTAVLDTFGDTCAASASPRFNHTLAQNRYKGNYLSSTGLSARDEKAFDNDGTVSGLLGDQVYGMYGSDGPFNRGPFRFYFAIDPKASLLHYSDSDISDKRPYQLLSQGYHLSGNCKAIDDDAPFSPSPYGVLNNLDLLQASGAGTGSFELAMSGYYHVSAFVDTTFKDRIIIDESTSNTFANAKHCSYTFDGRPPLLTIYRSTITPEGENSLATDHLLGQGIRSVNIFDTGREQ